MKELFRLRVAAKRQITIPKRMMNILKVKEGEDLQFTCEDGRVTEVVACKIIPAYLITPEVEAAIEESRKEFKSGQVGNAAGLAERMKELRRTTVASEQARAFDYAEPLKRKQAVGKTSTAKNEAVFGLFSSRPQAEHCVDAFLAAGFRSDDISVLAPDQQISKQVAVEKNPKAPEGTTTGATAGGALGGTLGLLAGIGSLAVPGVGPFIAAGPIMGALAGLGVGAATGMLIGALVGMGIPEYEAKRYEGLVKKGGILIAIHCDDSDWGTKAKDILGREGAKDIASAGEKAVSSTIVESEAGFLKS